MTTPLKQIIDFRFSAGDASRAASAWLSARDNAKYETEIHVTGGEYACITIVYWEPES